MTFKGHEASVNTIDINSNDSLMYSGSNDNTIRIWKTYNGELIQTISFHSSAITKIVLSMKYDLIISCSSDKTIKLIDIEK